MREDGSRSQNSRTFFNSFNSLRYRKTSYSIDLCPRDLITKSWRQRSRSYEKTVQFWIGHRTAAVSMKKTSVAAADYSTIRLRRPSLSDSICLLDNMHGQRPNFHPIFTLHSLFITDILSAAHQNGAVTGWAGGRQLYMWKFFFLNFFYFIFHAQQVNTTNESSKPIQHRNYARNSATVARVTIRPSCSYRLAVLACIRY